MPVSLPPASLPGPGGQSAIGVSAPLGATSIQRSPFPKRDVGALLEPELGPPRSGSSVGGGQLESFYFACGEHDAYVVVDLPDNESATAVALTVNAAGGATVRTVVLLTPDEVDAAAKRAVDYRPPGA